MKKILFVCALLTGLSPFSARASLVAYYNFNNPAAPFTDSSGNGNNITGTAGTAPVYGSAIGFGGTGAYDFSAGRLIAPVNVNPGVMPAMTWGAWVRTDSLVSGLRKVLGHDDGAWDRTLGLDNRNPSILRYTAFTGTANNSGPVEGTPSPVSTTDWSFIAASHSEALQTITFYIDLDASTTADPLFSITELAGFGSGFSTFAIGDIRPDVTSEPWDGAIDNVFVFNEALNAAQLTAFRNAGGVPEPSTTMLGVPCLLVLFSRRRRQTGDALFPPKNSLPRKGVATA
jgi:hypothetical protein